MSRSDGVTPLSGPVADKAADVRATFLAKVAAGRRLTGVGVGCGLTAQCAEIAGADWIGIYNSAPLRLAGHGSLTGLLAIGNASEIVLRLAVEVSQVVGEIPLVAGLLAADRTRSWPSIFDQLAQVGVVGIQNSPTTGLVTGPLRTNLDESCSGYTEEIKLIRQAVEAGFLGVAYAFNDDEVRAMVDVGASVIVLHLGLTGGGTIGARTVIDIGEAAHRLENALAVVESGGTQAVVCCHGGPITSAADYQEIQRLVPGIHGFLGASTFERLPIERAVTEAIRAFISLGRSP